MKVFISQPMSGKTDEEIINRREEIKKYCIKIFKKPMDFIDSFTKPNELVEHGRVAMLGHSVSLMYDADLVVFDEKWDKSPGCRVERFVCEEYGIPVFDIDNPVARVHKLIYDDILFWR